MTYKEKIAMMQREKELVEKLNTHLQNELDLISEGNVQSLEDSMPSKQKLLKSIIKNREDSDMPQEEPMPEHADMMKSLEQDLVVLWKKASALNDISKKFVSQRLNEIDNQLKIFFTGLKGGYSKDGRKASVSLHTIKIGA